MSDVWESFLFHFHLLFFFLFLIPFYKFTLCIIFCSSLWVVGVTNILLLDLAFRHRATRQEIKTYLDLCLKLKSQVQQLELFSKRREIFILCCGSSSSLESCCISIIVLKFSYLFFLWTLRSETTILPFLSFSRSSKLWFLSRNQLPSHPWIIMCRYNLELSNHLVNTWLCFRYMLRFDNILSFPLCRLLNLHAPWRSIGTLQLWRQKMCCCI